MRTIELANRVALGLVETNPKNIGYKVIAAGPLIRQLDTTPFRVVLTVQDSEFTVHREYFDIEVKTGHLISDAQHETTRTHIEKGEYFQSTKLQDAVNEFANRLRMDALFIPSVYRGMDLADTH